MADALSAARHLRRFNRFYTRRLGLLQAGHLESAYSLPEVRVLYELAHRPEPTATDLAEALDMDEGYLSRLLRRLRQQGLVRARPAAGDARRRLLTLTARGRREFARLDARATAHVAGLLEPLADSDRDELVRAAGTVEALLGDDRAAPAPAGSGRVDLRPPEPGDLGWVVQRHGELYHREYGWNEEFERLVARIVGEFAAAPAGTRQRCWIATLDGRRAGCVFLMPGAAPEEARLRLLLVEPWARGAGLGGRLVAACIEAARAAGYQRLTLWTNDVLDAARRIYQRTGFRLRESKRHHSFGKSLVGQTWERELQPGRTRGASRSPSRRRSRTQPAATAAP